ncbi:MAG: iron-sulfur cluster assembly protein [bacterium]
MLTETEVMKALGTIIEPGSGVSLIDLGMVENVEVEDNKVKIKLGINFDFSLTPSTIYIINSIKKKLHSMSDVDRVDVELLSQVWEEQVV